MSCKHGNHEADCGLCEAEDRAYQRGYEAGKASQPAMAVEPVAVAWAKVSTITGQIDGLSLTQDCELRSQRLEPLGRIVPAVQQGDDAEAAMLDAITYGTGVMRGGKHIPYDQLYAQPTDDAALGDAEIKNLAMQAGIKFTPAGPGDYGIDTWYGDQYLPSGSLQKFARIVRRAAYAVTGSPVSQDQDAARYRWLRDSKNSGQAIRVIYEEGQSHPAEVDRFIDAAMQVKP